MTVLSDRSIRARIDAGRLTVYPLGENAIQPNSCDVRLGPILRVATPDGFRTHHLIDDGPFRLHQHAFVLGATLEWVEIPDDLAALLAGKSTRAREGVQVESAGLVDSGWRGQLTLEIVMLSPVPTFLRVGEPIAQLYFHPMTTRAERPYGSAGVNSHYQDSRGPVPARLDGVVS